MELRKDGWYRADKGKHFVLTEKGKAECASLRGKTVGDPVQRYDTEAVHWSVESGYEVEVPIPGWVRRTGYEVVYSRHGCILYAGQPFTFPEREIAENYLENCKAHPWINEDLFIREGIFEGKELTPCNTFNGKRVYNMDWYCGVNALLPGCYVEEDIVDEIVNNLPPTCNRADCTQSGEPSSLETIGGGTLRATYVTFKKVADGVWEYCGKCFRGENTPFRKEGAV